MARFRFVAFDAGGQRREGVMEATSQEDVVARLQAQGQLPVEARALDAWGSARAGWRRGLQRPALPAGDLLLLTRQLATLLGAGQPLDRALALLAAQPRTPQARAALADIRDTVRGGTALSAALDRHPELFPRLYRNLVRAGEAGGSLPPTLERLADYLERAAQLRTRIVNALVYPVILLAVVGGALLFLLGYVVPQFAQMYASLDVPLPWFTALVIGLGEGVGRWWPLLVAVPCVLLLWLLRRLRDPAFRLALDRGLLRLRGLGPLLARVEAARLLRTLGTLAGNGVPLLAALDIAGNVLGNRALAAGLAEATAQVRDGRPLSAALARTTPLPPLAIQMVQVGEESGALETMLLRAADTFEAEAARVTDRLLAALVPAITLLLATVVGVVIVAVLVPLYDLTGAVG